MCISIRHAKHNVFLRVNESRSNLRVSSQIKMILPIIVIRIKGHDIDYCIKWDNLSSRSEKMTKKWRYFDDIFEMVVKSLETTGIYWNLRNFWSNKILFFFQNGCLYEILLFSILVTSHQIKKAN